MSELFKQSDIVKKLQRYCVYQDRCHKDVTDKMKLMKIPYSLFDNVLVELIKDDFLNEERFSMAFVRGKFKIKKWGRRRLASELKQRNISKFLIQKALGQISETDYKATFEALVHKKAESITGGSIAKKRKKLADYLLYRGWEAHLVYDKINQIF
jgi:regulatory protein